MAYCQYLLSSQINYTLTNFAKHSEEFSHDTINRYLTGEQLTPRLAWENVRAQVVASEEGYVLFDDTVLDKRYAHKIELVRRQYSGNAGGVIKRFGLVTCVYVNPASDQFWLLNFRIYDPAGDGKSKLDHVQEMLNHLVYHKHLPFYAVLMDTWYATKSLMRAIEALRDRKRWCWSSTRAPRWPRCKPPRRAATSCAWRAPAPRGAINCRPLPVAKGDRAPMATSCGR